MIEVKKLVKKYGSHEALHEIDFEVNDGEILGFLGPNGAGKSTTMNILTGYLSATAGKVVINGFDILDNPNEAKASIGYLPELPPLYQDMTVKEYLNFVYDLKKCKLPRVKHITEICHVVKIDTHYNRLIKNLSKGYRQRVGLAQALIGNPPVLILDEPTVGLDPTQIIEIRNLIKNLGKHHTVILSSHILSEVEAVCDRIVIVNNGNIVANGTTAELADQYSNDKRLTLLVNGPEQEVKATLSTVCGVKLIEALGEKEPGCFAFFITPDTGADVRRDIFSRLSERNWPILSLKSNQLSLEEIFVMLTQNIAQTEPAKEGE